MVGITYPQALALGIIVDPKNCICKGCSSCQIKYSKMSFESGKKRDDNGESFCSICSFAVDDIKNCADCGN